MVTPFTALRRRSTAALAALALALPVTAIVTLHATAAQAAPAGVTVRFQSNYLPAPIRVGETALVVVSHGSVTRGLGYQWLRDGVNIPNATDARYQVVGADYGKQLSVRITLTTDVLPTTSFVEVAGTPLPGLLRVADPTVTGEAVEGGTLSTSVGLLAPGATSSFTWVLTRGTSTTTIGSGSGASSSVELPAGSAGAQVHVEWKLEQLGYGAVTLSSAKMDVAAGATSAPSPVTPVTPVTPMPTPAPSTPAPSTPGTGTPGTGTPGTGTPGTGTPAPQDPGAGVAPPSGPVPILTPVAPAKWVVTAPKRVKQGKKFSVTFRGVAGKASVKASHLKRTTKLTVASGKRSVTIAAPKVAKGKKSRTVRVSLVITDAQGVVQRRTVSVKVVR